MSGYLLGPDAERDLDDLWGYIAQDSVGAADRLMAEIFDAFEVLARHPGMGHKREDLTLKLFARRRFVTGKSGCRRSFRQVVDGARNSFAGRGESRPFTSGDGEPSAHQKVTHRNKKNRRPPHSSPYRAYGDRMRGISHTVVWIMSDFSRTKVTLMRHDPFLQF